MADKMRPDWCDLPVGRRIAYAGHRAFVGGNDPETWYGIGLLQYHFLIGRGLRPDHRFLDLGCGALRLGQLLIPYLEAEHYFGLEPAAELVELGLRHEVPDFISEMKQPRFAYNAEFDVSFCPGFDHAIAQSIFTHMTAEDIGACFARIRPAAAPGARFYFTFFEGDDAKNTIGPSHANLGWNYRFEQIEALAARGGWRAEYIGDWRHPREQMMAVATPLES
ncbi:MAG: hypothetical protein ACK5MQ_06825 [Pikeienuella sp.]